MISILKLFSPSTPKLEFCHHIINWTFAALSYINEGFFVLIFDEEFQQSGDAKSALVHPVIRSLCYFEIRVWLTTSKSRLQFFCLQKSVSLRKIIYFVDCVGIIPVRIAQISRFQIIWLVKIKLPNYKLGFLYRGDYGKLTNRRWTHE